MPLGAGNQGGGSGRLNLDCPGAGNAEEITVYARRHAARPASKDRNGPTSGGFAISGRTRTDQIGFSGMNVTASLPVPGLPGLDAVARLSGGHEAINSSATRASASLTGGFGLEF
jgi:hypothetical protein